MAASKTEDFLCVFRYGLVRLFFFLRFTHDIKCHIQKVGFFPDFQFALPTLQYNLQLVRNVLELYDNKLIQRQS